MHMDKLIDQVINQVLRDVEYGDLTAIEELLRYVPRNNLEGYLDEGDDDAHG